MKYFKQLIMDYMPNVLYIPIACIFWLLHPKKLTKIIIPFGGCWYIWTPTETYYTLNKRHLMDRGSVTRQHSKFDRYSLEDFAEVEEGDTVVDVGAFLGEFSIPAAKKADSVIAIEPDQRTYKCLLKQTKDIDNITTRNVLAGDTNTTVEFKMADDPTESSIINVDRTSYLEQTMEKRCLVDILDKYDINHVDFLKADAEGAEPEVLAGAKNLQIQKVAVDAGNERFGEETVDDVRQILNKQGYDTIVKNNIVFGKK